MSSSAKSQIIFFSILGGWLGFSVVGIILPIQQYLNSLWPNMGNVFCLSGEIAVLGSGLIAVVLYYKEGLVTMVKAGILSIFCYFCYLLLVLFGEIARANFGWIISSILGIFFGSFYFFLTSLVLLLFPSPNPAEALKLQNSELSPENSDAHDPA